MNRKWRNILIGIVVAVLLLEIGLRFLLRSKALVEIVNNGTAPIENLRVTCNGEVSALPPIPPGKTGSVYLSGRSKTPMTLTFRQTKSVLSLVNFDDFNPSELEANREKFVIEMADDGYRNTNEETGESEGNLVERAFTNVKRWLEKVP